jgi:two-component system response regulator
LVTGSEAIMPAEILYVEDNPGEAFLLREAVRKLNRDVRLITASDGEAALTLLFEASLRPAVIVLDLDIPKVSGTEVFKAVKSHPELRAVRTVVFAPKGARMQIQLTGFAPDLFLTKPMDLDGYTAVAEQIISLCASS